MSKPASLLRPLTQAPLKQPPQGLTKAQVIFTPGGSQLIKNNLMRVFENRDYRIYSSFLTGVTAFRSAFEIPATVGKVLLNTATWACDFTSPRSQVRTILTDGFFEVLHSVKTTIALPFFSIAGLIFPSDVFGLFENIPGAEVIKAKVTLEQMKAQKSKTEAGLIDTQTALSVIEGQLHTTTEALAQAKVKLAAMEKNIANAQENAEAAERARTDVEKLQQKILQLQNDEIVAKASLNGILNELAKQQTQKELIGTHTSLFEAQKELLTLQSELGDMEGAIEQAKVELDDLEKKIEQNTENSELAEQLRIEAQQLRETIAQLKNEQSTETLSLNAVREEIERLKAQQKEDASRNNELLASYERDHSEKAKELERIKEALKEVSEKQQIAQSQLEGFSQNVNTLTSKAVELTSEVQKLETTKLELTEGEKALRKQIESQQSELDSINFKVEEAKNKMTLELQGLKEQIETNKKTLLEGTSECERLSRERDLLQENHDRLSKQVRELEYTTLPDQISKYDSLVKETKKLDEQKSTLESELTIQKETLRTKTEDKERLEGQIKQLEATFKELQEKEANLNNTVIPELEEKKSKYETAKAKLIRECSTERKKLQDAKNEVEEVGRSLVSKREEEASLKETLESIQQAIREASETKTGAEKDAEKTLSSLQEKLQTLGKDISESTDREAKLRLSVEEQERAFNEKTKVLELLTTEASEVERKILQFKDEDKELTSKIKTKGLEIQKLELQETALKEEQSKLQESVQSLTESVKTLSTQSQELQNQARIATEQKEAVKNELDNLKLEINNVNSIKSEIESENEKLRESIDSQKKTLSLNETEHKRLEEEIKKLKLEEYELSTKITTAQEKHSKQSEVFGKEKEAQETKLKELGDTEAKLSNAVELLKQEEKSKAANLETLKKECDTFTSSKLSLSKEEEALKEAVKQADISKNAATERLKEETTACEKMQKQTLEFAAQAEELTKAKTALAEEKQKLEAEFEARQQALDETLRKREREAIEALELKLKEQKLQSPSRTKTQSPLRTNTFLPSPLTKDLLDVEARLGIATQSLEKKQQALRENQEALEAVKKESDEYKTKLQADLERINNELKIAREDRNRVRKEASSAKLDRDKYLSEAKLAQKVSATTPIRNNTNSRAETKGTEAKNNGT